MTHYYFILGAPDPEMEEIERLLRDKALPYGYAFSRGRRVHPASAYEADHIEPVFGNVAGDTVAIECGGPPIRATIRLDHHNPGDPGYGREPEEYLEASSLGQLLTLLGDEPTPRQRLIAAADHCLASAYAGRCPGVDPQELLHFRAEERARFQRRPVAEVLRDIEGTTNAFKEANQIPFQLRSCPWHENRDPFLGDCVNQRGTDWAEEGCQWDYVYDMRREPPFPELPEAAARKGASYISGPLIGPDGRKKITCGSPDPRTIRHFMTTYAPTNKLVNIYGDPARGFAGGYLP